MQMICGLCREMLLRVNVQYCVNCQRRVLIKTRNGAFYGPYTAILRERLAKRMGAMTCFEDEISRDLWEMYACRMTTLEK